MSTAATNASQLQLLMGIAKMSGIKGPLIEVLQHELSNLPSEAELSDPAVIKSRLESVTKRYHELTAQSDGNSGPFPVQVQCPFCSQHFIKQLFMSGA